jgi:hypothetical protein
MATMILYNKNNGAIYGYFGTPYPTIEEAINMCFPEWDIGQEESYEDEDHEGEIYLDDLKTDVFDDVNGKLYLNLWTGDAWEEQEIRNQCSEMTEEEYEEYIDSLIQQGRERIGGLILMFDDIGIL